ncbi:3'5'-cyclic nucleotide phosphodiesterase family protein [Trichomonas vaginalis G3]|uniref:Phosphodiesterase n=1 Tax=Trichomonas vaginalis (strain ATCC PRA-98 / G3) TaxID=412133 RepID=A2DG30_TRIV3|nr:cyclic nucleotide phosphodiesterase family [Trichomonas vaginalis G3]EAY20657.1 3'5'-cyclic nucleotide phosphodiesterase family protein [Trichomonas vaginalis G3]KAI5487378.1 cyclic nucleotide phosphodiesterase family [Trichomonas vaginalis G3]|eukprot:XP_001581643.1 3'5'-cyclic nucleotide phosphodiesterase family protein [Trichomonas vaginalis G3]
MTQLITTNKGAKLPQLIGQANAKISQPKLSLAEMYDAMMEKARYEGPYQSIEIYVMQMFNASHIILWVELPHQDLFYSPSYSLVCQEKKSIIATAFLTISPMSIKCQKQSQYFCKGLDDKVIPENYSVLTIPILNRQKHTIAVIQVAKKPEKAFGPADMQIADWLLSKFKIYGSLLFDDTNILESAIGAAFTDADEETINNIQKTLQREFGCRRAEIWRYHNKTETVNKVVMDGKNVAYQDEPTGCVSWALKNNQIIIEQDVQQAPGHIPSIDGCFAESIVVYPFIENEHKVWGVSLRGRISGFRNSDIAKLKTIVPIIIRSLRIIIEKNKQPPEKDTKKQGLTALLDVAEQLSGVLDIDTLIPMIMQRSCDLLEAERCSLFLVNNTQTELISYFHAGLTTEIRIPINTGIVGVTATTGEIQVVNNAYEDPRFDSSVDKKTGFKTRNIITVPIFNNRGEIAGVTELMNKITSDAFTEDDVSLLRGFNVFCGIALDNSRLYQASTELTKQVSSFIEVSSGLTKNTTMRNICESILQNAINICEAKSGILYLLDGNEKITPLISLNTNRETDQLIVKRCIENKSTVVMTFDEVNEYLGKTKGPPKQDKSLSHQLSRVNAAMSRRILPDMFTENSICLIPLKSSDGNVLGVMEVDTTSKLMTESQKLLECFAVFASVSLERNHLKDIAQLGSHEAELKQQMTRDERDSTTNIPVHLHLPQRTVTQLWTINFDSLDWTDIGYFQVVFAIFSRFNLQQTFNVTNEKLYRFLIELRAGYRPVPYHNWAHAVDVLQFTAYQVHISHLDEKIPKVELFALLVAAICHDLNHDGFTNDYNVKAETPLGILFKNQSVMEMHHCEVTIDIMSNDQCNLFSALPPQQFKQVWNLVINLILATDMAKHFTILQEFNTLIDGKTFSMENENHRHLLLQLIIKVGDLSNVSRPFDLANRWCAVLCEEFFRQGDLEMARGMQYSSALNDREHLNKEKSQIGFYTSVCLPLYQSVAKVLPQLESNVVQVESNLETWKSADEAKIKKEQEMQMLSQRGQDSENKDENAEKTEKVVRKVKPVPSNLQTLTGLVLTRKKSVMNTIAEFKV